MFLQFAHIGEKIAQPKGRMLVRGIKGAEQDHVEGTIGPNMAHRKKRF